MDPLIVLSAVDQVAAHLREEILRGGFGDALPGVNPLSTRLGVNRKTVDAALRLLEKEGLLVSQGSGRKRKIVMPKNVKAPALRVAILTHDVMDRGSNLHQQLWYRLEEVGHRPFHPQQTLSEIGSDLKNVASMVRRSGADAWVIGAGSKQLLHWFAAQETPAFALFGRRGEVPIAGAGPDKSDAFAEATRRLIELGHRRISFIGRSLLRSPKPGRSIRAYLDELESAGIRTGPFNLPSWEESADGFEEILSSLSKTTPPTALFLDEAFLYNAALHHLAAKGLRVPDDVSLICTDAEASYGWCRPSVAHVEWDFEPVIRRIVRWTGNVARGIEDRRQSFTEARFVEGGTIGPAPN
ncbi:MAG: substrate-binding domain-containing protein [Haloferula sp.]